MANHIIVKDVDCKIGDTIKISYSFKEGDKFKKQFMVTKKTHSGFIALFKDRNPLHTDGAYARKKGFRGQVMHGNILGGFISYVVGECLPNKNVVINSQSINYRKPVYLNEKLFFV